MDDVQFEPLHHRSWMTDAVVIHIKFRNLLAATAISLSGYYALAARNTLGRFRVGTLRLIWRLIPWTPHMEAVEKERKKQILKYSTIGRRMLFFCLGFSSPVQTAFPCLPNPKGSTLAIFTIAASPLPCVVEKDISHFHFHFHFHFGIPADPLRSVGTGCLGLAGWPSSRC